jgi:hypothetical protein
VLAAHLLGPVQQGELDGLLPAVGDGEVPGVAQVLAAGQVEVVDDLLTAEVVGRRRQPRTTPARRVA